MKNLILTTIGIFILGLFSVYSQTARVQVIHNSADIAAEYVDVYLNGTILIDDFQFRTASPYVDVDAGVPIQIDIAPSNSMSVNQSIATFNYTLTSGETYVIVANGIVSPSGYSPATAFDLHVYASGREASGSTGNTDVLVFHGATDAPTVDVFESSVPAGTIIDDLSYGAFSNGYLELGTADYVLNIQDQAGSQNLLSYDAPLSTLGLQDQALVVLASGFLDPSMNSNGEAFGLYVALPSGGPLVALSESKARVQVIHNSADLAAQTVDVYLNDEILIDDFDFRTASPFVDAPAEVDIQVSIAPSNSMSVLDAIATFDYNLKSMKKYVIVANGIVSPSGYSPATAFDLHVYDMAQESANMMGNTDVLVFHGATDAPIVDVYESSVPAGTIIDDLSYGAFSNGYLQLGTADYVLNIQDQAGSQNLLSYDAPLSTLGLQDQALVVLASGFLDPSMNSNGEAFGLYVALPSGGPLVALSESKARVQVIHNSADLAAQTVDVYLNDEILIDDFDFRTASPFVDAPAEVDIQVSIAPSNSMSVLDAIATFDYNLKSMKKYVIVANGIVSPSGYSPANAFDLHVYDMAQESANMMGNTDVLVFHGATDAPAVDVFESSVPAGTIIDDLSYGAFSNGYLELGTADYVLNIQDQAGSQNLLSYDAPLSTLGLQNQALVVLASGFLDPSMNSNGEAFGLYVALPSGGPLVALGESKARVQVIHNSADLAAQTVDVYLNDEILIDDFDFRTASPFVDAPAEVDIQVSIAPSNSMSVLDAIATFDYNLKSMKKYVIVANGIVSPSGYSPATAFDLHVYDMAQESANMMGNTDVLVFHGATDAPIVDVYESSVPAGTIVDDIAYGSFSNGYLELGTADYTLDIKDQSGMTTVASYEAPLATLGLQDQALVVVASGFLDPTMNSNGPAFGLYASLSSGGPLVPLPVITDIEEIAISIRDLTVYPNPAYNSIRFNYNLPSANDVIINIYNATGSLISNELISDTYSGINDYTYDVSSLDQGQYILILSTNNGSVTQKFSVIR
jgi:hypothetical protein